mmetsp:Transcript_12823/g.35413  ORF Transcript_12823/g.35413 Transcript_12823/m.35413 type:complete len:97 (-) Transcript_12823:576-866(-)
MESATICALETGRRHDTKKTKNVKENTIRCRSGASGSSMFGTLRLPQAPTPPARALGVGHLPPSLDILFLRIKGARHDLQEYSIMVLYAPRGKQQR